MEDENGQIVRESMKDNDVLTQYRTMRETLIYLSHLDHDDTEQQMVAKLRQQVCCPAPAALQAGNIPSVPKPACVSS